MSYVIVMNIDECDMMCSDKLKDWWVSAFQACMLLTPVFKLEHA